MCPSSPRTAGGVRARRCRGGRAGEGEGAGAAASPQLPAQAEPAGKVSVLSHGKESAAGRLSCSHRAKSSGGAGEGLSVTSLRDTVELCRALLLVALVTCSSLLPCPPWGHLPILPPPEPSSHCCSSVNRQISSPYSSSFPLWFPFPFLKLSDMEIFYFWELREGLAWRRFLCLGQFWGLWGGDPYQSLPTGTIPLLSIQKCFISAVCSGFGGIKGKKWEFGGF